MQKKYITKNFKETQKFGREFAKNILSLPKRHSALVLGLSGNLGGGKTTFLQGLAKGLGIKEKILSPTFVIMKKFKNFYHIDCYRLKNSKDILDLGWEQIIHDPKNIVAIEWPEKVKTLLPKDTILIKFKFINQDTREINFKM